MAIVGYARVSSLGQSLEVQQDKLKAYGIDKLFEEKRSGVDNNRPALKLCLEYLREGDTLVISRVDRLARSTIGLHKIVEELETKGIALKALDQPLVDTRDASGRAFMGILAVFSEFEMNIRKERQMDGIAKAKANKVKFGRKLLLDEATIDVIKTKRSEGLTIPQIIEVTKLSKASVYRALGTE